jgi:hypothetical protein
MTELRIERCPACDRLAFDVNARVCQRCHVAVPLGTGAQTPWLNGRRYPRKADQDRVNPYADYARTRQDKD